MKNARIDRYSEYEKIAGRNPWYEVLLYRLLLVFVDTLSMASIFAVMMTVILYKSWKVFTYMVDKQVAPSVLITYIGMLLAVFATFTFAYTYLCARKYTPPIVEALATRLSGGHDIEVPVENGNEKTKVATTAPADTK